MAISLRREGRFADYFVEGTSEDVTAATVADLSAAQPMAELQGEPAYPLPPVPVYVHRPRVRRNAVALVASLAVNAVLFEIVIRLVAGR